MTEREKMVNEQLYNPEDEDLSRTRIKAKKLCDEYNSINSRDVKRNKILNELFGYESKAHIEKNFWCDYGFNIELGENFYSNHNLVILDVAKVKIGKNAMLAPNVGIYTATHPVSYKERISGLEYGRHITIGDNVWIGANSTILPGVEIGDNVVIAAGAVVNKSFPSNVIIGGVPAKIIKSI